MIRIIRSMMKLLNLKFLLFGNNLGILFDSTEPWQIYPFYSNYLKEEKRKIQLPTA